MINPPVLVPDWQRNYSWTTSEVDTFWKDLLAFNEKYPGNHLDSQEYFLGSVVIVESANSHLLLDGQQRLATSAILLSVIRDFHLLYSRDAAIRLSNNFLTDYDDATETNVWKLTLNHYDKDFFKREVLENREGNYQEPSPSMESHRLIRKAREYFTTKFKEVFSQINDPLANHKWALRIQKVLTKHVSIVAVYSGDEDNAAIVFETLNDRGIGLSTPDLLRNLLLRRARENEREEIIDLWKQILQSEDDVKLKAFLRHFWISQEGDVKTQTLYREIKSYINSNDVNSLDFSRRIAEASAIYRDILSGNDPSESPNEEISRLLKDINDLDASIFYPALLSAFKITDDADILRTFLTAIISVVVRYHVIIRLESSVLEASAFAMAKVLCDSGNFTKAFEDLRKLSPSDSRFQEAFEKAAVSRNATVRYILRELEQQQRQTEELEVSTPSRVHVEHIYPQTPPPERRWNNHGDAINRLGNLTLLSKKLNIAIRNSDFLTKRPSYEISEILITKSLAQLADWNFEAVEKRQKTMSDVAPIIWPSP